LICTLYCYCYKMSETDTYVQFDDVYDDWEDDEDIFFIQECSGKYHTDYLANDVIDMASYDTFIKYSTKPDKFTINIQFNHIQILNNLATVIQAVPDSFDSPSYQYTLSMTILFPFGYRISNINVGVEFTNFTRIHFQLEQMVRRIISEAQSNKYSKNLIEIIYKNLINFVPNVSLYCIGCAQAFDYEPSIPTFCNRDLCLYQMINVGLTDLYNELLHYSLESDLKISFCYSSLCSQRRNIIFGEIPSELKSSDSDKAYENMKQLLALLPSVQDMLQMTSSNKELRHLLNSLDRNLYYFLTWIILSCQNYIKDVTSDILNGEDKQFPKELLVNLGEGDGDLQYLSFTNNIQKVFKIVSDSPQRENQFQQKEASPDYQVELVYHGTHIENLHNILHTSLENCSGTSKQVNGAAYGEGIYLGKNLHTSLYYSRPGKPWEKTQVIGKQSYSCCIVVKFAKPIEDTLVYKDVGFYVVKDKTLIQTRYLLMM
jgi:hypothetical protein